LKLSFEMNRRFLQKSTRISAKFSENLSYPHLSKILAIFGAAKLRACRAATARGDKCRNPAGLPCRRIQGLFGNRNFTMPADRPAACPAK